MESMPLLWPLCSKKLVASSLLPGARCFERDAVLPASVERSKQRVETLELAVQYSKSVPPWRETVRTTFFERPCGGTMKHDLDNCARAVAIKP